ncbi:MAG: phenylacetate--CoA ligase family protein, partial [Desulfobacteraceae bacterium]|nr:phenylacetate--CoA ligase family protein [Desulfobacteraceae bacterium]
MKNNVRLERTRLDRLRFALLKDQLQKAYADVPFYTDAFNRKGLNPQNLKTIEDLKAYPIINKADIQKDESRFLSKKFACKHCYRSHSSGSTGRPLWVSFDKNAWIRKKYLIKMRARRECGLYMGQQVAIFDTDPPEELAKRNKKKFFSNPILTARYFSIFEDSAKSIDGLAHWRPQNIDSLPSHLFQLAQAVNQKQLKLSSIKRIFTSSEYLEPNMKQFIAQAFDAAVFDIYGCTEIKEVAWECERHEGYHINEDEVLVEILDGDEPACRGEVGDIVITDLRNQAMPLIRYRIEDRGLFRPGPCSCGRTFALMAPSAGRSSDFIITPDGHKLSPYRFTTAIEKIDGLLQYQLIQEDVQSITVKAIMAEQTGAQELREIQKRIQAVVVEPMDIKVKACEKIDIEENGKFKVVKNRVKEPVKAPQKTRIQSQENMSAFNIIQHYATMAFNVLLKPYYVVSLPKHVQVEVTTFCNMNCLSCGRRDIIGK